MALTRLIDSRTGYVALCHSEKDVDTILSGGSTRSLKEIGLEPRMPPEIVAQRSVICRRIDPFVGTHTATEIKNEIKIRQEWCDISEIIKFGNNTHVFKIIFTDTTMAQKAQEQGLVCFNMRISPEQIQRETFVNIMICFKCYEMETHVTSNCLKKDHKICSECADTSHIWKDCNSSIKKYINCNGPHRTMAMACPLRKKILKEKDELERKKQSDKGLQTYAQVAKLFKTK